MDRTTSSRPHRESDSGLVEKASRTCTRSGQGRIDYNPIGFDRSARQRRQLESRSGGARVRYFHTFSACADPEGFLFLTALRVG